MARSLTPITGNGKRKKVIYHQKETKEIFYQGLSREDYTDLMMNILIYGLYGDGKTHLLGTMDSLPRWLTGDILLITGEKGSQVLPEDNSISVKSISDYEGLCQAYEFLKTHIELWKKGDKKNLIKLQRIFFNIPDVVKIEEPAFFGTFLLDSLTEVQQFSKYSLIDVDLDKPSAMLELPETMRIQDWGSIKDMLFILLRMFRDLEMHKVMIAQEEFRQLADGSKEYSPGLQGSAKQHVHGFFNAVLRYKKIVNPATEEITRRLFFEPIGNFSAKHRYRDFNELFIDNPTFLDIVQAKYGKNAEKFTIDLDKSLKEDDEKEQKKEETKKSN